MESTTYSDLRKHLAQALDRVNESRAPLLVTRRGGASAVLMSLDDFHSYEETLHLLRSPINASRLQKAIEELRAGEGRERELDPSPARSE